MAAEQEEDAQMMPRPDLEEELAQTEGEPDRISWEAPGR